MTFDRGLQLTIEDWGESGVLAEQQGTLTEAGRLELATLQADLGCADLQETYGCPDCADGGGTRLVLGDSTHTWEYSSPPAELLDVDTWFLHLRDALRDCSSTEWVQVANDCEAFRWP
ncbi:MAG: hypothetical protein KTR31_28110 [Myxococcales bacterium]|nr:hypothetical protein [Myxococcales bacterium]